MKQLAQVSTESLRSRFLKTREYTEKICSFLNVEDYNLQGMADTSPPKWHLAHTTWFYECFLLKAFLPNYTVFHEGFHQLFNSYYETVGNPFTRAKRGLLTRPSISLVYEYRSTVTQKVMELLKNSNSSTAAEVRSIVEIGIEHEKQHQELLLMDIKYSFSLNPMNPALFPNRPSAEALAPGPINWLELASGTYTVGASCDGFHFDNESPKHACYINPVAIADRLITNGEYLDFIEAGGYEKVDLWLSEAWDWLKNTKRIKPEYWSRKHSQWFEYTLYGVIPLDEHQPVCHLSYFEADAYARWRGLRLPTEFEWEVAASLHEPNLSSHDETLPSQPLSSVKNSFYYQLWQWTQSSYQPYPGFSANPGALGEYNGKFMCNQYVLRGGSFASPSDHIRSTYRNFFPTHSTWMFSGMRLAKDL